MKLLYLDFAHNLKEIRTSKGISQKALAEKLGVTPSMISAYENGKRKPGLKTIERFKKALDCTGDDLMGTFHFRDTVTPSQIDVSDLSEDEIKDLNNYMDFIKYKRHRDL